VPLHYKGLKKGTATVFCL